MILKYKCFVSILLLCIILFNFWGIEIQSHAVAVESYLLLEFILLCAAAGVTFGSMSDAEYLKAEFYGNNPEPPTGPKLLALITAMFGLSSLVSENMRDGIKDKLNSLMDFFRSKNIGPGENQIIVGDIVTDHIVTVGEKITLDVGSYNYPDDFFLLGTSGSSKIVVNHMLYLDGYAPVRMRISVCRRSDNAITVGNTFYRIDESSIYGAAPYGYKAYSRTGGWSSGFHSFKVDITVNSNGSVTIQDCIDNNYYSAYTSPRVFTITTTDPLPALPDLQKAIAYVDSGSVLLDPNVTEVTDDHLPIRNYINFSFVPGTYFRLNEKGQVEFPGGVDGLAQQVLDNTPVEEVLDPNPTDVFVDPDTGVVVLPQIPYEDVDTPYPEIEVEDVEIPKGLGIIIALLKQLVNYSHNILMKIKGFVIPDGDDDVGIDFTPISGLSPTQKFPFSLPWDLKDSIQSLNVPGEAPHWTWEHDGAILDIDFEDFETFASISRVFLSIIFVVGLIIVTRRFIGGP